MLTVSRSIHIDAPVERVFALMADPLARSRLHPDAEPIRVEIEGGGPLRAGGVVHFRLQIGNRIADYRTRVRELDPARRIVSLSDSAVPFEVRIETEPEDRGTRLTQTETSGLRAAHQGTTGRAPHAEAGKKPRPLARGDQAAS